MFEDRDTRTRPVTFQFLLGTPSRETESLDSLSQAGLLPMDLRGPPPCTVATWHVLIFSV